MRASCPPPTTPTPQRHAAPLSSRLHHPAPRGACRRAWARREPAGAAVGSGWQRAGWRSRRRCARIWFTSTWIDERLVDELGARDVREPQGGPSTPFADGDGAGAPHALEHVRGAPGRCSRARARALGAAATRPRALHHPPRRDRVDVRPPGEERQHDQEQDDDSRRRQQHPVLERRRQVAVEEFHKFAVAMEDFAADQTRRPRDCGTVRPAARAWAHREPGVGGRLPGGRLRHAFIGCDAGGGGGRIAVGRHMCDAMIGVLSERTTSRPRRRLYSSPGRPRGAGAARPICWCTPCTAAGRVTATRLPRVEHAARPGEHARGGQRLERPQGIKVPGEGGEVLGDEAVPCRPQDLPPGTTSPSRPAEPALRHPGRLDAHPIMTCIGSPGTTSARIPHSFPPSRSTSFGHLSVNASLPQLRRTPRGSWRHPRREESTHGMPSGCRRQCGRPPRSPGRPRRCAVQVRSSRHARALIGREEQRERGHLSAPR